jgi:PRTRC genetic system protein B
MPASSMWTISWPGSTAARLICRTWCWRVCTATAARGQTSLAATQKPPKSSGQEAFATVHEAKRSPDGGAPYLDAGQPLTIDFLTQLAKGLGRTTECETLPPNILAYTPDMLVWWTRRRHRVMFYGGSSDGRSLSGKVFPQPPLVFKVCGSALSVRALGEDRRPQPNTALMVGPYWNCDRQGGRVCQGSMRVPGNLCLAARKAWENAFFESEFTHAALGATLKRDKSGHDGAGECLREHHRTFPEYGHGSPRSAADSDWFALQVLSASTR